MNNRLLHNRLLDRIEVELALRGRSLSALRREHMRSVLLRIDQAQTPEETEELRSELEYELLKYGEPNESRACSPEVWLRTAQCA